jgi:predicted PurR-regulated permease PerM
MRQRFNGERKYTAWGLTAFCVIAAAILFYYLLGLMPVLAGFLRKLIRILSPFIVGIVITYLLAPLMRVLEKKVFQPLARGLYKGKKKQAQKRFARICSVVICMLVLLIVLAALVYLIIPQLISSIQMIVGNSNTYIDNLTNWAQKLLQNYPDLSENLGSSIGSAGESVGAWLKDKLLPRLGSLVTSVSAGVYSVALALYNLIIGIIVSIYLMLDLERFKAACKRLLYTIFSVKAADSIQRDFDFFDRTFMGFLSGKLLDSAIIGLICYIGCAVMQMPYALLVSIVIGITNIIPFFGPLIGLIPSAIIILMVDPFKCLIFVVFVLILQQVDGNILGPKILGNSVGIDGFWIMFSIILGSGLFGFWGMLLGVPVFVVIYTAINKLIVRKLERSDLPAEVKDYVTLDYIDPATMQIVKKADARREELEKEKTAQR